MKKQHRRNGKVARLSKQDREFINRMFDDGETYAQIIRELRKEDPLLNLNEDNLANWQAGGYQDWLAQQECLDRMNDCQEFTFQLFLENKVTKIHQATLHLAVAQICQILTAFDPATFTKTLKADPAHYPRLLNVFSKLVTDGLKCEHENLQQAKSKLLMEEALEMVTKKRALPSDPSSDSVDPNLDDEVAENSSGKEDQD